MATCVIRDMPNELRDSTCRTCLSSVTAKNLVHIFSGEPFCFNLSLQQILMDIAPIGVVIDENDLLPVNICLTCAKTIKRIAVFQGRIKASDNLLRSRLQRTALPHLDMHFIKNNNLVLIDENSGITLNHNLHSNTDALHISDDINSMSDANTEKDPLEILSEQENVLMEQENVTSENKNLSTEQEHFSSTPNILSRSQTQNTSPKSSSDDMKMEQACPKCPRAFSTLSFLERHLEYHDLNLIELQNKNMPPSIQHRLEVTSNHSNRTMVNTQPSPVSKSADYCRHCKKLFPIAQLGWHIYLKHKNETNCVQPVEQLEECKYCSQQFKTYQIKPHIRKCHAEEHTKKQELNENELDQFECNICDKRLCSNRALRTHIVSHNRKFQCEYCGQSFKWKRDLTIHFRNAHQVKSRALCYICGKMISSSFLNLHYQTHIKKSIKCTIEGCNAILKYNWSLRDHILCKHGKERTFICECCGKSFAAAQNLRNHKRRSHMGFAEWRFSCTFCNRKCYTNSMLQRHIRVHQRETNFSCPECSLVFAYEPFMLRHVATQHPGHPSAENYSKIGKKMGTHQLKEKFSCPECSCKFVYKSHMLRHIAQNHPEHPSIQDSFRKSKSAKRKQNFSCPKCSSVFAYKPFMLRHVAKQHPEHQFVEQHYPNSTKTASYKTILKCDYCSRTFLHPSGLRKHIISYHPICYRN